MNNAYTALRPLVPGKAVDVLERNERDELVGAWFGYWDFRRGTVALYPNVANHNVNWPGGVIPKGRRVISDRSVAIRNLKVEARSNASSVSREQSVSSPSQQAVPPLPEGEAYGGVQQKIKFY